MGRAAEISSASAFGRGMTRHQAPVSWLTAAMPPIAAIGPQGPGRSAEAPAEQTPRVSTAQHRFAADS